MHFVGLVNVLNLKAGGLGNLGAEQLEWLKRRSGRLSSSTPIVVFAHVPLWTVYPEWGWGTDDSEQALALLQRFGSVTVLNGHIHQIMQKVEGNVTFHTAMSTAFPQPAPGTAPSPGPLKVEPARLRSLLGLTSVTYLQGQHVARDRGHRRWAWRTSGPAAPDAAPRREHAAAAVVARRARDPDRQLQLQAARGSAVPRGGKVTWINARRRAAPDRERGWEASAVVGPRYQRPVYAHARPAGELPLLLHPAPADDGDGTWME